MKNRPRCSHWPELEPHPTRRFLAHVALVQEPAHAPRLSFARTPMSVAELSLGLLARNEHVRADIVACQAPSQNRLTSPDPGLELPQRADQAREAGAFGHTGLGEPGNF